MKKQIALLLAAALTLSLLAGCSGKAEDNTGEEARVLAEAAYPEMAPYPNYMDYQNEKDGQFDDRAYEEASSAWEETQYTGPEPDYQAVCQFTQTALPVLLGNPGEENRVCSPLNIYMALELLAEITDGETRQQILELLGLGTVDALREQAPALWGSTYRDDGRTTLILGSSVWLNQDILFNQNTLNTLADTYYASAYQGEMGSEAMNAALQGWLNEQTGGLLKEQAGQITLDPDIVIALATTIYFQDKWGDEFWAEKNTQEVFHGAAGDVTCDFMHQTRTMNYYYGDHYSAISRWLANSGQMWLILPDEEVGVTDLLTDPQVAELLSGGQSAMDEDSCKYVIVNQSIPKFDVSSDLDLVGSLQELGITDVFRSGTADFTPLTQRAEDAREIFVSKVEHAARVIIDEEGVLAAAYTEIEAPGAGAPPEEVVDFVLDRPFLFVIQNYDGLTLFAGIVNQV